MSNTTILDSIRKKIWLVILVIGVSLLAFVIDPQTLANFSFINKDVLGEVNGNKILLSEYNELYDQIVANPQFQNMPKNSLINRLWDELVQEKIIENKIENLGIEITEEAVLKNAAQIPQFAQNPEFQDKGKFSPSKLIAFINTKAEAAKKSDIQALQFMKFWEQTKKSIKQNMATNKYVGMIASGLLSNNSEVSFVKKQLTKSAQVTFVQLPYSDFLSTSGKISDDEINEYVKNHPNQFKVKENRDLGYVLFASVPSQKDRDASLNEINAYITGKIIRDNKTGLTDTIQSFSSIQNDSIYVMTHSEQPFSQNYYQEQQLPVELQNFVKSASIGSISRPIQIQNVYFLSKLIDKRLIVDSTEVSHILIGHSETAQKINSRTKAEAKQLADKILNETQANSMKFYENLALSDDKGSIQTGGKYVIRYGDNQFVPEFTNFATNNPVGKVAIVESQFGYHIMKVDRKSAPKTGYKLANIVKTIQLSPETTNNLYKQATSFIQKSKGKSLSDFANLSRKNNYKYFTEEGIEFFGQLNRLNSDKDQEIIQWAFDKKRELGETNMFTTSNGDYIVVHLSGINDKGLETANKARKVVEPLLKNKKIAEKLKNELKKMSNLNPNTIALKYKKNITNAQVSLAGFSLNNWFEPKVVGSVFALKPNQVSKPIGGELGVYVAQLQSIASVPFNVTNDQLGKQIENMNRNAIQIIFKEIKDNSDITDRRKEILN